MTDVVEGTKEDYLAQFADKNALKRYWKTGEGAAKIRWGTDGDFTRCVRNLREHVGEDAEEMCAQWHYEVNGFWPGDARNNAADTNEFKEGHAVAETDVIEAPVEEPEIAEAFPEEETPSAGGHEFYQNSVTKQIFRIKGDVVESLVSTKGWQPSTLPAIAVSAFTPVIVDPLLLEGLQFGDNDGDADNELSAGTAEFAGEDVVVVEEKQDDLDKPMEGGRFRIPIVIPEGVPSGDRRLFVADSLEFKEPPMPLLWQKVSDEGHNGSVTVGRIDKIERLETGGLGNAEGVFDTHADAVEAARQVKEKFLTGVSGDVDQFKAELTMDEDGEESITIHHGRLVAATLVAKPAFQEATIEFVSEDGEEPVILASAGPLHPDRAWFNNPNLEGPTRLTVTDDGRVFGHIATWDTKHMANSNITPPKSRSNYKYFNAKPLRLSDGEDILVGQLTLAGGHADLNLDARRAAAHYDNTESAVADVVAGEDQFGIWVAGAMRPTVSETQIRAFRASDPSGDWRMTDDGLELIACCQVNVPGFPVARTMVAAGQQLALVAAGADLYRTSREENLAAMVASLNSRLSVLERERDNARRAEVLNRLRKLK